MSRNFMELLQHRWDEGKFVCVGLDPVLEKMPHSLLSIGDPVKRTLVFNRSISQEVSPVVCCFKPNGSFYERFGEAGQPLLRESISDIHKINPDSLVIVDIKKNDIGKTLDQSLSYIFEYLGADAVTVNGYPGIETFASFLEYKDKGIIFLCKTSNPGSGEFQDLPVLVDKEKQKTMPLYQYIAKQIAEKWNKNGNCALVVGATYPEELGEVRHLVGDMPILIPGIGTQGGDIEKTVINGKNSRNQGMIINSSSGIIFAGEDEDFAQVARQKTIDLNQQIKSYL